MKLGLGDLQKMNLQFRTNSKIQMCGSYQDQTKLEKPRECWSFKKGSRPKCEGIFVRSIQEYGNLSDSLPLPKKRKDERCVIKNICPSDAEDFYRQNSFKV